MKQVLNLSKGCFRHGTVVHEMLHTLGFYHMQSTYDRDDYVKINWENIKSGVYINIACFWRGVVGSQKETGSPGNWVDVEFW